MNLPTERVVIITSESPTLPDTHLNAAFDTLREAPSVVGPAQDGGYYLIGLSSAVWPAARALFEGAPSVVPTDDLAALHIRSTAPPATGTA